MKALMIAMLVQASTAVGGRPDIAPPTRTDLDFARVSRIHAASGIGGVAHCVRFADLQCRRSSPDPAEFHCQYREWTRSGPWARKSATLRWDGADWRWLGGDTPQCSFDLTN